MVRKVLLAAWFGAVIAAWLAINFGMDDPATADERFTGLWPPDHPYWFSPLISIGAIVAGGAYGMLVARAFGWRTRVGSAALGLAFGIVAWSFGNLVWFWYNTCTSWGSMGCAKAIETPYPSMADVGFLLLLPAWTFAMVQLARVLATTAADLLRLAWIPLVAVVATSYITVPPIHLGSVTIPGQGALFESGYSAAQQGFSTAYVIGDVVLLSLSLMVLVRSRAAAGGWFFRPMLLASGAMFLQYVADLVFDTRVAHDKYYAGDVADLLYFLALFTMVCCLHGLLGVHERMERSLTAQVEADALLDESLLTVEVAT
jgi:hypothetical protein